MFAVHFTHWQNLAERLKKKKVGCVWKTLLLVLFLLLEEHTCWCYSICWKSLLLGVIPFAGRAYSLVLFHLLEAYYLLVLFPLLEELVGVIPFAGRALLGVIPFAGRASWKRWQWRLAQL